MATYYLDVYEDAPYNYGMFRDETGSPFLLDFGACQHVPHVISDYEEDLIARNREIARIPFSWVT